MTKRWKALLGLVFVFALVAAACGDSADDTTATSSAGNTSRRPAT